MTALMAGSIEAAPGGRGDRLVETVRALAQRHTQSVARHDRDATVHSALVDELCAAGYHLAPLDRRYGGGEHGLLDVVRAQAALAEVDASTALGVGMHLMVVGGETWAPQWSPVPRHRLFSAIARRGALVNVLATEPVMGSPQGDARPATSLEPDGPGRWRLHGLKTYSTFSPVLRYAVVYAAVEDGSGEVARVLVPMHDVGVGIEHTWDTVGMRATASHSVYFAGVQLTDDDILLRHSFEDRTRRPAMTPWFVLPVAAVYLGIARAARDEAVAAYRRPHEGRRSVADAEARRSIGEIEWRLHAAEAMLEAAATRADAREPGAGLSAFDAATKLHITRTALEVVDLACRVAGGAALRRGSRLERAWRDVRCGSVHPPADSTALELLADHALR